MAEEKKVVIEEETVDTAQEMDFAPEDEFFVEEEEKHFTLPRWVKKAAKIGEASLAVFGGVVAVLLIKDGCKSKGQKTIDIPAKALTDNNSSDAGIKLSDI